MRSDANNSKHWQMRAAEARALANSITDAVAKQTMLGIARSYDKLAERAAKQNPPAL